jgi:transposase InsO family protein
MKLNMPSTGSIGVAPKYGRKLNGIHHLLTAVRSPATTGKIERFHRTVRDELLSTRSFSSVADVQRA